MQWKGDGRVKKQGFFTCYLPCHRDLPNARDISNSVAFTVIDDTVCHPILLFGAWASNASCGHDEFLASIGVLSVLLLCEVRAKGLLNFCPKGLRVSN